MLVRPALATVGLQVLCFLTGFDANSKYSKGHYQFNRKFLNKSLLILILLNVKNAFPKTANQISLVSFYMLLRLYSLEIYKGEEIGDIDSYFNFVLYQVIFLGLTVFFLSFTFLANELLASEIERGDLRASLVSVRQTISNIKNISGPELVNWFKDTFDLYTKAELDEFARIEREKVVHLEQERAMKEAQLVAKMKEEIEKQRITSIDEVKQQEIDAKKV